MKIKAAEGLARILKAEGVTWVSTFPTCGVNNALGDAGLRLLMMRDERYVVAVADAFSRVTGGKRIGVCTTMGGVHAGGLQMAYGAVAQAFEDSSPMLCITDGVPIGASDKSHYDMTLGFKAVTKWIGHIDQPQRVPEFMRRAFTYLRTGRPGPVLLTLPRDICALEYDEVANPYAPVKGWKSVPDPTDVEAAVQAFRAAKNPLLYVGDRIFYADATQALLEFAELAQVPVMTSLKGKSAFPEHHPLSVGVRGQLATHFLRKCDLVFAIGSDLHKGPFSQTIPVATDKTIVQCTVDERDINLEYQVDHALIGDVKFTLQALIGALATPTGGRVSQNEELVDEIKTAKETFMARYRPLMTSNDVPINPYRVYGDLMRVIDVNNSFVTHDSGNTRDQTSTVYEAHIPHGYMGWGKVTSLGFGLAAAMAAKLAYPERQCVNITGDAGVGYMLGNFEALVRNEVGVTTIHINNGGFSGYGPGFWGAGHSPYTSEVSDHSVADMSRSVAAMGYYAEDVAEPAHIIPALKRAFEENARNRPAYLEVLCSKYPVYGEWVREPGAGH